MGQQFQPTQTFEAEVNGRKNRYHKGQTYTVHDTPAHEDLGKKLQAWAKEGKAVIIGQTAGPSRPARVATGKKGGK